jgi:hypothetical protein
MQVRALREFAAKRGWTVAMQAQEVGSGAARRELREQLVDAARRREIDVVPVWRLDRWGRSLVDLVVTLRELSELGVGLLGVALAFGLTVLTMAYAIGHLSGCHLDPAVSVGLVVAEAVLTLMFLVIILKATDRRAPQGFAPIAIGLRLTLITWSAFR